MHPAIHPCIPPTLPAPVSQTPERETSVDGLLVDDLSRNELQQAHSNIQSIKVLRQTGGFVSSKLQFDEFGGFVRLKIQLDCQRDAFHAVNWCLLCLGLSRPSPHSSLYVRKLALVTSLRGTQRAGPSLLVLLHL